MVDPLEPSITVWELVEGKYVDRAHGVDDETVVLDRPFPVEITPSALRDRDDPTHGLTPNVLIRNVSAADLDLLDKQARRLGLSRSEFLRRQLHQVAGRVDLDQLADLVQDLGDEAVMTDAWT